MCAWHQAAGPSAFISTANPGLLKALLLPAPIDRSNTICAENKLASSPPTSQPDCECKCETETFTPSSTTSTTTSHLTTTTDRPTETLDNKSQKPQDKLSSLVKEAKELLQNPESTFYDLESLDKKLGQILEEVEQSSSSSTAAKKTVDGAKLLKEQLDTKTELWKQFDKLKTQIQPQLDSAKKTLDEWQDKTFTTTQEAEHGLSQLKAIF
uniref:Uncharacterized protein n=1 Tax=Ditylenchus dipsaci TaxID=166011 RepID=A0A915CR36_9BILA